MTKPANNLTLGQRLRLAREAMHLSEKDIAARLHLSVTIISQIEDDDFVQPHFNATFLRGYVRSYARVVNIPEEEVNHAMDELGINSSVMPTVQPTSIPVKQFSHLEKKANWLTYAIVLALVGLVAIFWQTTYKNHFKMDKSAKLDMPAIATEPTPALPPVSVPVVPAPGPTETLLNTPTNPINTTIPPLPMTSAKPTTNLITPLKPQAPAVATPVPNKPAETAMQKTEPTVESEPATPAPPAPVKKTKAHKPAPPARPPYLDLSVPEPGLENT